MSVEYAFCRDKTTRFLLDATKAIRQWESPHRVATASIYQQAANQSWSGYREIDRGP